MATTNEVREHQEVRVSVSPMRRSAVENRVVLDLAIVDQYGAEAGAGADHDRVTEFFGRARVLIEQSGGVCGPVRPGNATFTFAITDADDALNVAIRIQEALRSEPAQRLRCAIGLATGPTHRIEADAVSVLGESVAAAHHLAEAANAGAVLADLDTIAAANMFELRSAMGERHRRTHREYVTPVGYLPVAGQPAPLAFVEVIWDEDPRGIRATALRDLAWWQLGATAPEAVPVRPAPGRQHWDHGRVRSWNPTRRHGFIISDDGEFFYVDDRFIVGGDSVAVGTEVWFVAKPSLIEGKNRIATTVLSTERSLEAHVVSARGAHRYTEVTDTAGHRAELRCPDTSEAGDLIVGHLTATVHGEPYLH